MQAPRQGKVRRRHLCNTCPCRESRARSVACGFAASMLVFASHGRGNKGMKSLTAAAMAAAASSLAVQPLAAAELPREAGGQIERGTFVGARFRVSLGRSDEKAHAGLALTATQRAPGRAELRFAKGLELGYAGDARLRLSLHGQPVSRLAPGGAGPDDRKLGISTVGWIGIGVGVVVLSVAGLYVLCGSGAICATGDD